MCSSTHRNGSLKKNPLLYFEISLIFYSSITFIFLKLLLDVNFGSVPILEKCLQLDDIQISILSTSKSDSYYLSSFLKGLALFWRIYFHWTNNLMLMFC